MIGVCNRDKSLRWKNIAVANRGGKDLMCVGRSKRNILFSTIEQKKRLKTQRPLCEIFTGRREREGTSSPLSSHARSWEASRSRMNYGMLAVRVVSSANDIKNDNRERTR